MPLSWYQFLSDQLCLENKSQFIVFLNALHESLGWGGGGFVVKDI